MMVITLNTSNGDQFSFVVDVPEYLYIDIKVYKK